MSFFSFRRIVILSSVAHTQARSGLHFDDLNFEKRPYNSQDAYYESKLANVLHCKELARRLQGTGITAYSLHPGDCTIYSL